MWLLLRSGRAVNLDHLVSISIIGELPVDDKESASHRLVGYPVVGAPIDLYSELTNGKAEALLQRIMRNTGTAAGDCYLSLESLASL